MCGCRCRSRAAKKLSLIPVSSATAKLEAVQNDPAAVRRAIGARAAAAQRVRGVTAVVIGVAAALTAGFTALAAGSTHPRRVVHRLRATPRQTLLRVVAPAPPLVAIHDENQPNAPQTAAPSAPPVAAPSAPPVVASGGS
jgi:hypothetical protein